MPACAVKLCRNNQLNNKKDTGITYHHALFGVCICSDALEFPSWFKFGSASSAYQIEGAWNVSDKGESKWDRFTHVFPEFGNGGNGDVACDSYHLWRRDIEMAAELGLEFYRFSINWPRLLPSGFANYTSQDGKNYYNNLIDGLLEKGIEPLVTIYHGEMPQLLEELGGWRNPLISDWFADYARVVYTLFSDRVKTWITINEPLMECDWYYGAGPLGTGAVGADNVGSYLCSKHILLAHAKAWRIYDEEFRKKHNGKVSLCNRLLWFKPTSPEDEQLAELVKEFFSGRYSHPIFSKEGGWPPIVEEFMAQFSSSHGHRRTMLPPFTPEEIELVRGTYDYYGVNYYTTLLVRRQRPGEHNTPSIFTYVPEISTVLEADPDWEYGFSPVLPIVPEGLREQLAWLKQRYGNLEVIITENGLSSHGHVLNDTQRISFIRKHLEQVLLSIKDGVNVTRYTYWSLMDDFEWINGYESGFGLYEVDFKDPLRPRTPRSSALYYANIIKHHSLNMSLFHHSDHWEK